MKLLIILLYTYIGFTTSIRPENILDVKDLPPGSDRSRESSFNVDTFYYDNEDKRHIIKVVYGDVVIWKSNNQIKRCHSAIKRRNDIGMIILQLTIFENKKFQEHLYYEYNYTSWININIDKFYEISLQFNLEETLEIRSNTFPTFKCITTTMNTGSTIKEYKTIGEFKLVRIIESGNYVWNRSSEGVIGLLTRIYNRRGYNILIHIKEKNIILDTINDVYLKSFGNAWVEIDINEFEQRVTSVVNEVILDIRNDKQIEYFDIRSAYYNNLQGKIFNAKKFVHASVVMIGHENIWCSDTYAQKCDCAFIHSHNGKPILARLVIKNFEDEIDNIYYRRHPDGTWQRIDERLYFGILTEHDSTDTAENIVESIQD